MGDKFGRISDEIADIIQRECIDYHHAKVAFRAALKKTGIRAPKEPQPQKLVQETEMDHLLAEEFRCNPNFAGLFADACGLRFETFEVLDVTPQPPLGSDGYGDLLVEAKMDGQRTGLLIEDKITAGAPPRQAERYAEYAEQLRLNGWDRVITVLVAPAAYRGERDKYESSVDLEELAKMIDSPDPRRRDYRRNIIKRALEKKERTGVQNPDKELHRLHADYRDWVEDRRSERGHPYEFPRLDKEYHDKDVWIDKIRHPDFPNHIWLRHRFWTSQKAATGMVDLIISPATAELREHLHAAAPEEAIVSTYGKKKQGIQISVRVPEMKTPTGFHESIAAKAFTAMERLTEFHLQLKKLPPHLFPYLNFTMIDTPGSQDLLPILRSLGEERTETGGDAKVQHILGQMYEFGLGVERDHEEAVGWYRRAAEQGDVDVQFYLGRMYEHGLGEEQDVRQALMWYELAAEQGHAQAQYSLGNMYERGSDEVEDAREAVKWYRRAAKLGHSGAQYRLGNMYYFGEGVKRDDEKAVKWYRMAADQGHSEAQFYLGIMYYFGRDAPRWSTGTVPFRMTRAPDVEQNYEKAHKWFGMAAGQGHAKAQFCLGFCHKHGQGVEQNHQETVKWYRMAAKCGDAQTQHLLGQMYANGEGVEPDAQEAVKWYRMAAKGGDARAKKALSDMYETDGALRRRGFEENSRDAVRQCDRAAKQGDVRAQTELGQMYNYGLGVPQNYVEALAWYNLAVVQGEDLAKTLRDTLLDTMPARAIAEALALSRQLDAEINRN